MPFHDSQEKLIAAEDAVLARNYSPLPVVITRGEGAWVTSVDGTRYLDCIASYSAVNFGHSNPKLISAAQEQIQQLTLTSRAYRNDRLGPFAESLTKITGTDMMLPMNTGAEAVESAIKIARAWGYRVKGIGPDQGTIVTAGGNFHGRTTTLVGLSDDPEARNDFGPYAGGFRKVPFGDVDELEEQLDDDVAAVLLEPIQGEAGVIIPPDDYLRRVRKITSKRNILLIADEIQSGLGRTGDTLESLRAGVRPDMVLLGKALGGGIVPVSAVVGRSDVLGVLRPGEHGSTFGGNPLASAVGSAVTEMLSTGEYQELARERGAELREMLQPLLGQGITDIRIAGLWAGIDIDPQVGTAREVCMRMLERGVLAKDTQRTTIRIAPPLNIEPGDLAWAVEQLRASL